METAPAVENVVTRFEITASGSNSVSTRFDSLIGGKPVGVRHAEDDDCTREEPVEYGPAAVTATRPHSEGEADFPL